MRIKTVGIKQRNKYLIQNVSKELRLWLVKLLWREGHFWMALKTLFGFFSVTVDSKMVEQVRKDLIKNSVEHDQQMDFLSD